MNITKKLTISSALIASLVLSPVAAFADGENTQTTSTQSTTQANQNIEAGITPDSYFYFFKQLVRDIHLYFANDEKEKAQLLLQYANEKAAELKVMNEANTTKYNDEQMKEIEDMVTQANQLIGGDDAEKTAGDASNAEQTPAPTSTTTATSNSTTTATSTSDAVNKVQDQQQPQDEQQKQEDDKMSPEQALAVLQSLLDKLPEQGRKGVENAIKHLEHTIAKQNQKNKNHEEEEQSETPVSTTTEATTGTSASTTTPAPATDATASTTSNTAAQTPATTTPAQAPAPTAPATMPLNPDQQVKPAAPATTTATATEEHHDNGLHLGWYKQKEKAHKEENHDNK